MFKKLSLVIATYLLIAILNPTSVTAKAESQDGQQVVKAQVIEIIENGTKKIDLPGGDIFSPYQIVKVRIIDGYDNGQEITINHGGQFSIRAYQKVALFETVVLTKIYTQETTPEYFIVDKYRLNHIIGLTFLFFAAVVVLSRTKGVGSIMGMLISLLVIVKFIVPQILKGSDPLTVSILGSIFILIVSIYLAHGFSKSTSVAVASTSLTLVLTGLLSIAFVNIAKLTGLGSEEATSLQIGITENINFRGLFLGGMIIGFLGVLDDITTSLSATIFEIKKVNPKLSFSSLVRSGLTVGHEHIASLVNTLILAYAGASLPLFLFIVLNPQGYPLWFIINSELIAEEIARTLVGSMGLLFAVPTTTLIASWVNSNPKKLS